MRNELRRGVGEGELDFTIACLCSVPAGQEQLSRHIDRSSAAYE